MAEVEDTEYLAGQKLRAAHFEECAKFGILPMATWWELEPQMRAAWQQTALRFGVPNEWDTDR